MKYLGVRGIMLATYSQIVQKPLCVCVCVCVCVERERECTQSKQGETLTFEESG